MGIYFRHDYLLNFMENFFEFHCHTNYSEDAGAKAEAIIDICKKSGVTGIALTDHNEVEGALELKKIAPNWLTVIVGEEIETLQGEIIGLFLSKKIPPGRSLQNTIREIKIQGGLVIAPHPFDRLRSKKISNKDFEKHAASFDAIEAFNARTVFQNDNEKAKNFALTKNKISIYGSDAHFIGEFGKTVMKNVNCLGPAEFLESLKKSSFITRKSPLYFHLLTKLKKAMNKINAS